METSLTSKEEQMTSRQRRQLGLVVGSLLEDVFDELRLSKAQAQQLHGRGDEIRAALREPLTGIIQRLSGNVEAMLRRQEQFYRDRFGLEYDFSGVKIPTRRPGFDRLVIVPQGLTVNQAYEACRKQFPSWRYAEDLDAAVPTNDRSSANGPYAIWVRDRVEADAEFSNWSANKLKQRGIHGITLLERLVYELQFFADTGKHLDVENVTLCSGSRYSDGYVPRVCWDDDELYVCWYHSGFADGSLRCREVVA